MQSIFQKAEKLQTVKIFQLPGPAADPYLRREGPDILRQGGELRPQGAVPPGPELREPPLAPQETGPPTVPALQGEEFRSLLTGVLREAALSGQEKEPGGNWKNWRSWNRKMRETTRNIWREREKDRSENGEKKKPSAAAEDLWSGEEAQV